MPRGAVSSAATNALTAQRVPQPPPPSRALRQKRGRSRAHRAAWRSRGRSRGEWVQRRSSIVASDTLDPETRGPVGRPRGFPPDHEIRPAATSSPSLGLLLAERATVDPATGTRSATGTPRSVTVIVSPWRARRRTALVWFFSSRTPTLLRMWPCHSPRWLHPQGYGESTRWQLVDAARARAHDARRAGFAAVLEWIAGRHAPQFRAERARASSAGK